jgi:hypothetical protein
MTALHQQRKHGDRQWILRSADLNLRCVPFEQVEEGREVMVGRDGIDD